MSKISHHQINLILTPFNKKIVTIKMQATKKKEAIQHIALGGVSDTIKKGGNAS